MRRRGGSAVPLDYLLVDTAAVPVASAFLKKRLKVRRALGCMQFFPHSHRTSTCRKYGKNMGKYGKKWAPKNGPHYFSQKWPPLF
jgi:hypothetical protein